MLTKGGEEVVEILVKNLLMSSAQIIVHQRENNIEYKLTSENISERCKGILRVQKEFIKQQIFDIAQ